MNAELYDIKSDQISLLFQLIADSDEKAFNRLFRAGFAPLVLFAHRYMRDKSTAHDIVQEAFIKLWQQRARLHDVQAPRSYLYRIVRNLCLNYLRDNAREQPADVYEEGTEFSRAQHESPRNTAQEQIDDEERQRRQMELLHEWVNGLPERQREAFELSRFEGLDHDEIAAVMGVSAKTVNNHITGALQNIRALKASYEKKNISLSKWQHVSGI